MALIKCPECGKKISDTSDVCIHCGYKFKKSNDENGFNAFMKANSSNATNHEGSAKHFAGNAEKVIAQRGKASGFVGGLCVMLGFLCIILFIIWLANGIPADGRVQAICFSVLSVGFLFFLLSIPSLTFSSKNNKLPDICISCNPYLRTLKLYCLDEKVLEINIDQFVEIKDSFSSNLIISYKNEAGAVYTAKLGKCVDDKSNILASIDHYKSKKR